MGEFSYEYLFDVVRRERSREELQKLELGFYAGAERYLEEQVADISGTDPLSESGEKMRNLLQNTRKLLKELYDRRERKIMLLAVNKARTGSVIIDTSALLPQEQTLFASMVKLLTKSRGELPLTNGEPQRPAHTRKIPEQREAPAKEPEIILPKDRAGQVKLSISADVPRFIGGSETYGPFQKGMEVRLPEKVARILIKKGRATEV